LFPPLLLKQLSALSDAPIDVGWGSIQTQFHGSIGKTAAQAPSITKVGSSPDDNNQPRISWRGDGAFFVVSSLWLEDVNGLRHRTLRVHDRQATLQSTSEVIPGLEHPLVRRPSLLELRGSVLKEAVRARRADTTSSSSRKMASDMSSLV
jgi:hypothetical protein